MAEAQNKKEKGKLFDKPQGQSKRTWRINGGHTGGDILCQACGTFYSYKKLGENEDYDFSIILGVKIVEICCGAFIDRLFSDLGEDFFHSHINRFRLDPLAVSHSQTRHSLRLAVTAWNTKSDQAQREALAAKAILPENP